MKLVLVTVLSPVSRTGEDQLINVDRIARVLGNYQRVGKPPAPTTFITATLVLTDGTQLEVQGNPEGLLDNWRNQLQVNGIPNPTKTLRRFTEEPRRSRA